MRKIHISLTLDFMEECGTDNKMDNIIFDNEFIEYSEILNILNLAYDTNLEESFLIFLDKRIDLIKLELRTFTESYGKNTQVLPHDNNFEIHLLNTAIFDNYNTDENRAFISHILGINYLIYSSMVKNDFSQYQYINKLLRDSYFDLDRNNIITFEKNFSSRIGYIVRDCECTEFFKTKYEYDILEHMNNGIVKYTCEKCKKVILGKDL